MSVLIESRPMFEKILSDSMKRIRGFVDLKEGELLDIESEIRKIMNWTAVLIFNRAVVMQEEEDPFVLKLKEPLMERAEPKFNNKYIK